MLLVTDSCSFPGLPEISHHAGATGPSINFASSGRTFTFCLFQEIVAKGVGFARNVKHSAADVAKPLSDSRDKWNTGEWQSHMGVVLCQ